MKKLWVLIIPIILIILFMPRSEEVVEIRIRVIAKSDIDADILYKSEVVEYIKQYFTFSFKTYEECDSYLENNLVLIQNYVKLKYKDVNISYGYHNFYNKTYDDIVQENKQYKTLLATISEGNGSNWWGSLYPYNLEKESTEVVKYKWFFSEIFK